MKYKFDAIKVENKNLSPNTDEVSNMYIVKINYSSLIELCGIGKVSINRDVDPERAKKMVKYIRNQEAFYPPLIVATTKKNLVIYDEIQKTISIDGDKLSNNQDMLVIDGQHRYTSIKYLGEESEELIKNRYQSIFLIDNLTEFQQRKIFIDINDTAKKVTTGTKLRLGKNLINYISLNLINSSESVQQKVVMDVNQTSDVNRIPYKFIIRGNEKLLAKVDEDFDKDKIDIIQVDKVLPSILTIWEEIFSIIEKAIEESCNIITNEAFYIAICEYIEVIFNKHLYETENYNIDENAFSQSLNAIVSKVKENIKLIDNQYYTNPLNRTKDRCDKIYSLIQEVVEEQDGQAVLEKKENENA